MTRRQIYTIDYERDEAGWWVASVRGVHGCHTQGRTIEQARARIHEVFALISGSATARAVTFREHVSLPGPAGALLSRHRRARARADVEAERAVEATRAAVRRLTELGLSTRDAGELLGLSRQRVHQILNEED